MYSYPLKKGIWAIVIGLLSLSIGCSRLKVDESSAQNQIGDQDPYSRENLLKQSMQLGVKKVVLDNGLTVLVLENHHQPIFSLYTLYRVGSRYEPLGMTGATHFLEHLMFKGTKEYKNGKFDEVIEHYGGGANAYTDYDLTVYMEWVPITALDEVLEIESDRLQSLTLDRKEFESERKVILEERKMRYENQPRGKLFLAIMQEMLKSTPYEESVIGKIKDIENVTFEQIQDYYKHFYAPNNAVLVIVGDFNSDNVLQSIKKHYGKLTPSPDLKHDPKSEKIKYSAPFELGKTITMTGRSETPIVAYAFPGEQLGTRRSYVMDILSMLLSYGESSYLVQKYTKGKKPIVQTISADNKVLEHRGFFYLYAELLDGMGGLSFKQKIDQDRKKWCQEAVNERAVLKAKNQYLVSYFNNLQTNSDVAHFLGLHEVLFGDYNNYKKELEIYNSITMDEVKNLCSELFKEKGNFFLLSEKK